MPKEDPAWIAFMQSALLSVLDAADEGLIVFDGEGRCRMIGRRAGEIFGVEPATHVGQPQDKVLDAFARACEEPDAFLAAVTADPRRAMPGVGSDVDVRRPRPRTVVCKAGPVVREGKVAGMLIVVRDVTRERSAERTSKQLFARITELTPFDTLTGLLNQRRFREELEREHGRSTRAWDSYAVLRLDVDGMGEINDEHGRPVGDEILERSAERLQTCLREYDVLARLEGDEFGVLLPGADAVAARTVGDRMLSALAAKPFGPAGDIRVTMSLGGAVWVPPSGETSKDIMARASDAIAEARAHGGACARVYSVLPGPTE